MQTNEINIKGVNVSFFSKEENSYISLTDMARFKNNDDPRYVVQNWMKTKYTVEFLGFWETMNNVNFKRIEFDTFKNEAGSNSFVLTPQKWISNTNSIGIVSKSGRYGGTYAHKDIAFEFGSWISPEFKLYLIKEFQRLKENENQLGWNVQKTLSNVGYLEEPKKSLIPKIISEKDIKKMYEKESDVINMAVYGITEEEWKKENPDKKGTMRENSYICQLVCLTGLESKNLEMIKDGLDQKERLLKLNEIAIQQIKSIIHGQGF